MMFPLLALVALLPLPLPLHSCQHRILSCKPETLIQFPEETNSLEWPPPWIPSPSSASSSSSSAPSPASLVSPLSPNIVCSCNSLRPQPASIVRIMDEAWHKVTPQTSSLEVSGCSLGHYSLRLDVEGDDWNQETVHHYSLQGFESLNFYLRGEVDRNMTVVIRDIDRTLVVRANLDFYQDGAWLFPSYLLFPPTPVKKASLKLILINIPSVTFSMIVRNPGPFSSIHLEAEQIESFIVEGLSFPGVEARVNASQCGTAKKGEVPCDQLFEVDQKQEKPVLMVVLMCTIILVTLVAMGFICSKDGCELSKNKHGPTERGMP